MTTGRKEQRNPYKGLPLRAWIRLRLAARDGATEEFKVLVDTGSPYPLVIGEDQMSRFSLRKGNEVFTNFGPMQAYWVQALVSEIDFDDAILGFAGESVVQSAKSSSQDFEGVVGLPFLRLMEFGGDESAFWIRPAGSTP